MSGDSSVSTGSLPSGDEFDPKHDQPRSTSALKIVQTYEWFVEHGHGADRAVP